MHGRGVHGRAQRDITLKRATQHASPAIEVHGPNSQNAMGRRNLGRDDARELARARHVRARAGSGPKFVQLTVLLFPCKYQIHPARFCLCARLDGAGVPRWWACWFAHRGSGHAGWRGARISRCTKRQWDVLCARAAAQRRAWPGCRRARLGLIRINSKVAGGAWRQHGSDCGQGRQDQSTRALRRAATSTRARWRAAGGESAGAAAPRRGVPLEQQVFQGGGRSNSNRNRIGGPGEPN